MRKWMVTLLAVAAFGVTGAAFAGKPAPTVSAWTPALFYDATGKVVGPYLPESMVLLRLEAHTVPVFLGNTADPYANSNDFSKAYWGYGGYLIFTESYCGGQAYINWRVEGYLVPPGATAAGLVISDGVTGRHILHVGLASDAVSAPISIRSFRDETGVCSGELGIPGGTMDAIPVTRTYDLDSLFTLPLTLK